jgi:hypothetical protein
LPFRKKKTFAHLFPKANPLVNLSTRWQLYVLFPLTAILSAVGNWSDGEVFDV